MHKTEGTHFTERHYGTTFVRQKHWIPNNEAGRLPVVGGVVVGVLSGLLVVCADATPLSGLVSQPTPASVAGFILTQRVLDEVTILYLSIDPRYRRQGLARQLVQALQVAVGSQTIMLEVRQSNEPARALYQQCGFIQVGERVNYYRSTQSPAGRETALLLHWQVDE